MPRPPSKHPINFSQTELSVPFDHCSILIPEKTPGRTGHYLRYAETLMACASLFCGLFPVLCFACQCHILCIPHTPVSLKKNLAPFPLKWDIDNYQTLCPQSEHLTWNKLHYTPQSPAYQLFSFKYRQWLGVGKQSQELLKSRTKCRSYY